MRHLKHKIWEDLEEFDHEIEKKGDFTEKELHQVHKLAEVYHLICKIENDRSGMSHERRHSDYGSPLLPDNHQY